MQPRNRARRLKLFAIPMALVAYLAISSMSMIWYHADLSATTVIGHPGVSAHLSLTGEQIAHLSPTPPAAMAGSTPGTANPSVGVKAGLLDPVFFVVLAALVGISGVLIGSLLLTGLSLAGCMWSWSMLSGMRAQFENPNSLGGFVVTRGAGQQRIWLAMTLMLAVAGLALVQAILARRAERMDRAEAGETENVGIITALVASMGSRVSLAIRDANESRESTSHQAPHPS